MVLITGRDSIELKLERCGLPIFSIHELSACTHHSQSPANYESPIRVILSRSDADGSITLPLLAMARRDVKCNAGTITVACETELQLSSGLNLPDLQLGFLRSRTTPSHWKIEYAHVMCPQLWVTSA
jgi:hypothetical protein